MKASTKPCFGCWMRESPTSKVGTMGSKSFVPMCLLYALKGPYNHRKSLNNAGHSAPGDVWVLLGDYKGSRAGISS